MMMMNAKVWHGKFSFPSFVLKCIVVSHPWYCSHPAESAVPLSRSLIRYAIVSRTALLSFYVKILFLALF